MLTNPTPNYDPRIQALLGQAEDDWGDPEVNRANIVSYGIAPIDALTYGMDMYNGEMNVLLGQEKNRKTTFLINILINVMTNRTRKARPAWAVDSLESGMNAKKYRDTIIANLATRFLMADGHTVGTFCPRCNADTCREIGLNHKYMRYFKRTPAQQQAIRLAFDEMMQWPLLIYDAHPERGDTRDLDKAQARWRWLKEKYPELIISVDHLQQYSINGKGGEATDYEKQIKVVSVCADFVAQTGAVQHVLSQVSLGSVRDARSGNGQVNAAGGTKSQQEGNNVFQVTYKSGSGYMKIGIIESRDSGTVTLYQDLEEKSGAFYGEPRKSAVREEENG